MALEAVAKAYGIDMRDVMAIGDGENDIPMIKLAGIGVAMANAGESVRLAADHITSSNMEGGVGAAIRKHALGGEVT